MTLRVAVTVDELILWDGTPLPRGYTAASITGGILDALREHDLAGVYGFAHTSPLDDRPELREVLETWCDHGHHLGNHTHCHACLNWVDAQTYCDDVSVSQELIGDLVERAPTRYFRHAMDMTGRTEARRGDVQDFLQREGFVTAPVTAWFSDFAWAAPYQRAIDGGDREAADMLRQTFVAAAVFNLQKHAEAARRLFGADLPYVWLVHGTPVAQDVLSTVLQEFKALGVEFIGLDDAMAHPVNRAFSPASPLLRNHLQRYALAVGDEVEGPPAALTEQVLTAALPEGEDPFAAYDEIIDRMVARAGGVRDWSWE